jgi:hypothetical protein
MLSARQFNMMDNVDQFRLSLAIAKLTIQLHNKSSFTCDKTGELMVPVRVKDLNRVLDVAGSQVGANNKTFNTMSDNELQTIVDAISKDLKDAGF